MLECEKLSQPESNPTEGGKKAPLNERQAIKRRIFGSPLSPIELSTLSVVSWFYFLHPPSTRLKLTIRSSVQHILSASCKWYIFIWETGFLHFSFFSFDTLSQFFCAIAFTVLCLLSIFLNLDHSVPYTYAIKLHTPRYFRCINPCQQGRFRCSSRKHVL